ncbi:hypothetical protein NDU88_002242 [Pleurodeles waltl]|uniref:Uncharacterized protein n=1 Tax=Pleurodeles waltl TaxID=8319 RepID=A0AAV7TKM9_PLEWA|nr:hypothetical protein NDU88_002242 [Pleurodeles waltl]
MGIAVGVLVIEAWLENMPGTAVFLEVLRARPQEGLADPSDRPPCRFEDTQGWPACPSEQPWSRRSPGNRLWERFGPRCAAAWDPDRPICFWAWLPTEEAVRQCGLGAVLGQQGGKSCTAALKAKQRKGPRGPRQLGAPVGQDGEVLLPVGDSEVKDTEGGCQVGEDEESLGLSEGAGEGMVPEGPASWEWSEGEEGREWGGRRGWEDGERLSRDLGGRGPQDKVMAGPNAASWMARRETYLQMHPLLWWFPRGGVAEWVLHPPSQHSSGSDNLVWHFQDRRTVQQASHRYRQGFRGAPCLTRRWLRRWTNWITMRTVWKKES